MFNLDKTELEKLNTWLKKHDKKCPRKLNSGCIGGRLTYCFTPTSLGVITEVKCGCGGEINLTDFGSW